MGEPVNTRQSARKFLLQVGQIVKPHGLRGEVGVIGCCDRPDLRFSPGSDLLAGPHEKDLRPVVVRSARSYKKGFLVQFESLENRDAVETMRGWGLFIGGEKVAPPAEGRYYHHQLIGLAVLDEQGNRLGQVAAVIEKSAQDLLELACDNGKQVLVPLVDELVREVNPDRGALVVRLPDGLLEL